MPPSDPPTNDNEGPPEPLWEHTPVGRRVMTGVSIVVLIAIPIFAWQVLDAAQWRALGITFAVAVVCMVVAAIYRLIRYGRA